MKNVINVNAKRELKKWEKLEKENPTKKREEERECERRRQHSASWCSKNKVRKEENENE